MWSNVAGMGVRQYSARRAGEPTWLALTLACLALAIALEHFILHRQMILPAIATHSLSPWMWGALFVPEMGVCFVAGWRLRSIGWLAVYAVAAALLRQTAFLALTLAGEPGHAEEIFVAPGNLAQGILLVAVVYFLVLGLASMSAREPGPVPNR